jgi:uncharacterized protein YdbL (DUF1318 family)
MRDPAPTRKHVRAAALVLAALLSLLLAAGAHADALGDAKRSGYVGEQNDGLLGLVRKDAPADVVKLVASVNAKRQAGYAEIAKKNGTSVSAVAALAAKKAIEKTLPGNYVQNAAGEWVVKR